MLRDAQRGRARGARSDRLVDGRSHGVAQGRCRMREYGRIRKRVLRCHDRRNRPRQDRERRLGDAGAAACRRAVAAAVVVRAVVTAAIVGGFGRHRHDVTVAVIHAAGAMTGMLIGRRHRRRVRAMPAAIHRPRHGCAARPHPRHRRADPVQHEREAEQGRQERTGEGHGGDSSAADGLRGTFRAGKVGATGRSPLAPCE